MWGAIISAALSIASSVAGGIANRNKAKKQREMLDNQLRENKSWRDREYYSDPTKRADTVRLLTQMQEQIRDRNQAAKGRQAVMGGTEDSVTAERDANNKAYAETVSNIVASNESRKDAIERQYQQNKQNIEGSKIKMEAEDAANTANVVSGVAGSAANIASVLDSAKGKNTSAASLSMQNAANGISKDSTDPLGIKAGVTDIDKNQISKIRV